MDGTRKRKTFATWIGAVLLALVLGLMAAQGANADAKTINDRAGRMADGCAKSGGKGSTEMDAEGHVYFVCKGGKGGDYKCDISTAVPICTMAIIGSGVDIVADSAIDLSAVDATLEPVEPARPGRVHEARGGLIVEKER